MTTKARIAAVAAAVALLALAACSGDEDTSVDAAQAPTTITSTIPASSTTTTTPATSTPTTAATTTTPQSTKVSANNTTVAELQRAFEAAGISNASRWALEVEEYRPYPSDPGFAKLRQELAKYNPGPGVVDQIVATLSLP